MASSLGPLTTSGTGPRHSIISAFPPSPFLNRVSQVPVLRNPKRSLDKAKVLCNSTNGDPNSDSTSKVPETPFGKVDRRNVLIGMGGLYGAAGGLPGPGPSAFGAPIVTPDLSTCHDATVPDGANYDGKCCPPKGTEPVEFTLPPQDSPLRVRPAAHLVTAEYLEKYKMAVQKMKELPDDDPLSFIQQANVHCAYCQGAYHQEGNTKELQVHFSWLFFPFHRFYLYFYERILGSLIDDPTFALPFWSWDSLPPAMQIPDIFADPTSPLYDKNRNQDHLPPTLIDLNYSRSKDTPPPPDPELIANNLATMYRQMVSGATRPYLFFGKPYRACDDPKPGAGTLESVPHNTVHAWTGLFDKPNADMGNFYTAGRDPIFFAHHANVDRMWVIWKTLGRRRKRRDIRDSDWLDSSFLLYNENRQLVRIKVRDCVDPLKLRYTYQDIPIPWLTKRQQPKAKKKAAKITKREPPKTIGVRDFPVLLSSVIKVEVTRPKKSRSKDEKDDEEEELVLKGIELDSGKFVKFDVYVDDDDVSVSKPSNTEFAGSFVNVPHKHMKEMITKTSLRLGLNELLEDLGAEGDDTLTVTIVPRAGTEDVTIGGIEIEFESD